MPITGTTAAEIYESVRALAQSGVFVSGQELPTVRELAEALHVNRNTVSMAYKRLASAGIAVSRGRLGTTIREPSTAGEREGSAPDSPLTDLSGGNPCREWLPDIASALARQGYRHRLYGEATVEPELEGMARRWLTGDCPDGFALDLTHGAVDAIERLLSAHLVTGDKVAVEDPCFIGSINTLRLAGLQAVGVPVDAQGMQADALERALAEGARAVIITPRAHNPTGFSLSRARASKLQRVLARHTGCLLIVDDHFGLLATSAYQNVIPPRASRWALVRSVSKMFGPDLRLAFVASDTDTSDRLRLRLAPGANWVSHLLQQAVLACMSSDEVAERVAKGRKAYAERRSMLAQSLAARGIEVATPADGLNLWLPLHGASQPLVKRLAELGWGARSGEPFGVDVPAHGLRITVSDIDMGISEAFAESLHKILVESAI